MSHHHDHHGPDAGHHHPFAERFAERFSDEEQERGPRGGRRGRRGGGPGGPGGPGFGPGWGPGFGPMGPGGPGRRGGGFGRPGGWQQADLPAADDVVAWFAGRLPSGWYTGSPTVSVDREEVIVVGELPPVDSADGESSAAAAQGRISRFREDTRDERVAIALEAEARYGRKVGWGATIGDESAIFTHQAVPVMTRLRQPQRQVLDTLVDAGVARSRSEALAWAVTLVGQHADEWLQGLREAMAEVEKLRTEGPQV
ncbi:hypothetical protein V3N99_06925 [Dermatophilaceae bacterium Soc4.6]